MFIIYGWGKKTVRELGVLPPGACGTCGQYVDRRAVRVTTWFTLFFIPVIPYRREYVFLCPHCKSLVTKSKADFFEILSGQAQLYTPPVQNAAADQYAGKTPTQIAYLQQMEARARQEAERDADYPT